METPQDNEHRTQSETPIASAQVLPGTKGPRTPTGKARSSGNATQHGLLSKAVLVKGESAAEYQELLDGYREAFQPDGAFEDFLVEKLATAGWRMRRVLLAESAEIQLRTEFYEWDQRSLTNKHSTLSLTAQTIISPALIRHLDHPGVLQRCLQQLETLKQDIESQGFNEEKDRSTLTALYGERDLRTLQNNLFDVYEACRHTSTMSPEQRHRGGYGSPEQYKQLVIQKIAEEIERLKKFRDEQAAINGARTRLEIQTLNVPAIPQMDRLLRYETTLERSFDRTLSQLERAQRLRRGQPVLPEVKVRVTQEQ